MFLEKLIEYKIGKLGFIEKYLGINLTFSSKFFEFEQTYIKMLIIFGQC